MALSRRLDTAIDTVEESTAESIDLRRHECIQDLNTSDIREQQAGSSTTSESGGVNVSDNFQAGSSELEESFSDCSEDDGDIRDTAQPSHECSETRSTNDISDTSRSTRAVSEVAHDADRHCLVLLNNRYNIEVDEAGNCRYKSPNSSQRFACSSSSGVFTPNQFSRISQFRPQFS